MTGHPPLQGLNVLLVEDESLVCLLTEEVLTDAGCRVRTALRLKEGLEIAETAALDLAVLDVNLGGGEFSYPIATVLRQRGIPFFFTTGYAAAGLAPAFQGPRVVEKPYVPQKLLQTALKVLSERQLP